MDRLRKDDYEILVWQHKTALYKVRRYCDDESHNKKSKGLITLLEKAKNKMLQKKKEISPNERVYFLKGQHTLLYTAKTPYRNQIKFGEYRLNLWNKHEPVVIVPCLLNGVEIDAYQVLLETYTHLNSRDGMIEFAETTKMWWKRFIEDIKKVIKWANEGILDKKLSGWNHWQMKNRKEYYQKIFDNLVPSRKE